MFVMYVKSAINMHAQMERINAPSDRKSIILKHLVNAVFIGCDTLW
jgi:hypothetical protein